MPFFSILFFLCLAVNVYAKSATPSGSEINLREGLLMQREQVAERVLNREKVMASRSAELKAKVEKFKDQKKAEVVQRVSDNLNKINTNQTDQMLKQLQVMSSIIDKISKSNPSSETLDKISSAAADIAYANYVVLEQAKNIYTVEISTEAKVKSDAKEKRDLLHDDLQKTRELVIESKYSVTQSVLSVIASKGQLNGQ